MPLQRQIICFTLLLTACNNASTEETGSDGPKTTSETSGEPPGTTTDPAPTTDDATSTGTTTASDEGTDDSLDPTTGGGANNQCDVWTQDCPDGQKCTAYADDGTDHWNSTHCVPVVDDPALPGDACTIADSVASGVDNCEKGSFCWYMDYVTLQGTCVPACTGSADAPVCPEKRDCDISNNGTLLLCLETCDPLVPSCPADQLCFSSGDGNFICDLDNSGDAGVYGDPCAFVNSCNYGLFCAYPEEVPGCNNSEGCCSEFCELLADPITCTGAPMQTCEPWFNEGAAPPGLEDVGYCTIVL